jgi:fermentation-respiration switch protein FrsA (DUF1100 family)
MEFLKWLLVAIAILYGLVVGGMYLYQRRLVFDLRPARTTPAAAGFPEAEEHVLQTADGEHIVAWLRPPADAKRPLILMLLGNGDNLGAIAGALRAVTHDGSGVLAVAYRGYSGSTGEPSEEGLRLDAEAGYRFALGIVPASRLVIFGYSLGSGVAVPLAAGHDCAALVLFAPFTSAVAIAGVDYPYLPVRILMKDQFRSDEVIGKVKVPILMVHGERDQVVPIAFGRELFAAAPQPKRFVALPETDHFTLFRDGGLEAIHDFLGEFNLM